MMNKKEIKNEYKNTIPEMGVFQIKNNKSGKILVQSAVGINGKINRYKFQLKGGMHPNKELQADYNSIGEEYFSFEILDYLKPQKDQDVNTDFSDDLKTLEELWIEKLQPFGENGYNKKVNK